MSVTTTTIPIKLDNYIITVLNIVITDTNNSKQIISMPSQIGCNNNCVFCISNDKSLIRNLTSDELFYMFNCIPKISEIVEVSFTGEGEPLHNIKAINKFINRISVSSVKIAFSGLGSSLISKIQTTIPITLQFSLHNATQQKRNALVPKSDNLNIIRENLLKYQNRFSNININYVIIPGSNDSEEDLKNLEQFVAGTNWNVLFNPLLHETTFTTPNTRTLRVPNTVKIYKSVAQSITENRIYSQLTYSNFS